MQLASTFSLFFSAALKTFAWIFSAAPKTQKNSNVLVTSLGLFFLNPYVSRVAVNFLLSQFKPEFIPVLTDIT